MLQPFNFSLHSYLSLYTTHAHSQGVKRDRIVRFHTLALRFFQIVVPASLQALFLRFLLSHWQTSYSCSPCTSMLLPAPFLMVVDPVFCLLTPCFTRRFEANRVGASATMLLVERNSIAGPKQYDKYILSMPPVPSMWSSSF